MPTQATKTTKATKSDSDTEAEGDGPYVLPMVHIEVPRSVVNIGYWGGLTAAAVVGAIELPVAVAIGAGVAVARHATNRSGGEATN